MGRRRQKAKRSAARLPKGLPVKNAAENPFETASRHNKRPKHAVANATSIKQRRSALQRAVETRIKAVKEARAQSKSANVVEDRRIGEYNRQMSAEEQNLARLVKERSRRSKRSAKYSLDDGDNDVLTHKGKPVDNLSAADHVILSDDEEDYGQLDTDMHFSSSARESSQYGPSSTEPLSSMYADRKSELDDLILRRKIAKAERLKSKADQVEAFEAMDDSFKELANMLQFRDKEAEIRRHIADKRAGTLGEEDQEMEEWDKEMKQYQFLERKVAASERTKTQEEIAKEEAARLHELETRRLARMNGDFSDDDLSDISDEEGNNRRRMKKKKTKHHPEALDNESDDENDDKDELQVRFTADGLVHVNRDGEVVGKVGETKSDEPPLAVLATGTRVRASYHANEQFDGHEAWYEGVISHVHRHDDGKVTYDVDYDDGDFEEGVEPRHVKLIDEKHTEKKESTNKKEEDGQLKVRRQKAKEKARSEMPFVFEVPTTLEALHDMIATHASTGEDASLIIQRIHRANSVRLDRRNSEKMQNFYDVLLRRFVAVGDAIYQSGDGGPELGRFKQLDALTKTMYLMAQDAPENAAAVWSRRLGIFQNAHAKRLRDAEIELGDEEDNEGTLTAWPSTGVFMTLRALGHIFPVTDHRHPVVTPAVLLLSQLIGQTPVRSIYDLVMGTICTGLLLEFSKDSKRVVPEAMAFLASTIRLFAPDSVSCKDAFPLPSLAAALSEVELKSLRTAVTSQNADIVPRLSFEKEAVEKSDTPCAILVAALNLVEAAASCMAGSLSGAEKECFAEVTLSLLALEPKKSASLPESVQKAIAAAVSAVAETCQLDGTRPPIQRRAALTLQEKAIKTLAPRLENPERYSVSKDKGKNAPQAALDRTRRELKREHKAISRELRLDASFVEAERRQEKEKKDNAARAKRQKAFAWLEGEQATMNQQVRQGGGLLQGGGVGAARKKAATAKLGMKKGGKL